MKTEQKEKGNISLRIPISLHKALKEEAKREKTSLNRLCLAKLSRSLKSLCGLENEN